MVFFIPWRVVAEESGAAHCVARPARAGASAAFVLVIFRFGVTMELGRSERPTLRPLWSYRVDGADSPDRKPRCYARQPSGFNNSVRGVRVDHTRTLTVPGIYARRVDHDRCGLARARGAAADDG